MSKKKAIPPSKNHQSKGTSAFLFRLTEVAKALSISRQRNYPPNQSKKVVASSYKSQLPAEGGANCPILVEGQKDKQVLRGLGFQGPIELVNRGWDMPKLCAFLYEKYGVVNSIDGGPAIILLMDWDRSGARIQREIIRRLESYDVKVEIEPRKSLSRFFSSEIKVVEGLKNFTDQLLQLMDE